MHCFLHRHITDKKIGNYVPIVFFFMKTPQWPGSCVESSVASIRLMDQPYLSITLRLRVSFMSFHSFPSIPNQGNFLLFISNTCMFLLSPICYCTYIIFFIYWYKHCELSGPLILGLYPYSYIVLLSHHLNMVNLS